MTIYLGTIRCVQDAYRRIATIFWRLCFYLPKHLGSLCRKSHGLYVDRDSVHAGLFDEGTRSQAKAGSRPRDLDDSGELPRGAVGFGWRTSFHYQRRCR